jgi:hypothetical protein
MSSPYLFAFRWEPTPAPADAKAVSWADSIRRRGGLASHTTDLDSARLLWRQNRTRPAEIPLWRRDRDLKSTLP